MNESISTNIKTESDDFQSSSLKQRRKCAVLVKPLKKSENVYSPSFKDNFNQFLEGKMTEVQLLQSKNYPNLMAKMATEGGDSKMAQVLSSVFKFKNKIKLRNEKIEDPQLHLKQKLQKLNNLILERVRSKQQDNDEKRRMSLQNVGLLKSIVDASEGISARMQKQSTQKSFGSIKQLKTLIVSYDDMKPQIRRNVNKRSQLMKPKLFMKSELAQSTNTFLSRLQQQQEKKQQELDRLSKLQIDKVQHSKHITFSLYNKDVLTYKDVELYDYLHNKPTSLAYECQLSDEDDDEHIFPFKKLHKRNKVISHLYQGKIKQKTEPEVSHTSSLQSTYEIHLDNMYTQTLDLQKQLKKKSTLPKKVRQLIKLDELNQLSMHTNEYKLMH